MILNELSVMPVGDSREEFDGIMSRFLQVCHKISTDKKDRDFFYTIDLVTNEFAPSYTIND